MSLIPANNNRSARVRAVFDHVVSGMNSWGWGEPPLKQDADALRWRTYRASVQLRADRNDGHGRLVFGDIAGKAEVWADGVQLGEKSAPEPGALTLPLAKGALGRTFTVLVQSQPGQPSGLIGPVLAEPGDVK